MRKLFVGTFQHFDVLTNMCFWKSKVSTFHCVPVYYLFKIHMFHTFSDYYCVRPWARGTAIHDCLGNHWLPVPQARGVISLGDIIFVQHIDFNAEILDSLRYLHMFADRISPETCIPLSLSPAKELAMELATVKWVHMYHLEKTLHGVHLCTG